jgi:SAM-dependent methyltransferase
MRPVYPSRAIARCPACDLVFYTGTAVPEDVYTREYFAGGEYADYLAAKRITQHNFRRRIADIVRIAPSGELLEIGSAYGFFLELAHRRWVARGVEIAADAVAHARDHLGLAVAHGDFLTLPEEPGRYDVVCMWDTIEHLMHPVRYLEKIGRCLKPGGHLFVTTGNIRSLVSRLRGARWRLIHPPTHMFYFSPATIRLAAARAGLRVCQIRSVGYSRSSRAMLHEMLMRGEQKSPRLYRFLTLGETLDVPVYLNLFDIMLVIAEKPRPSAPAALRP